MLNEINQAQKDKHMHPLTKEDLSHLCGFKQEVSDLKETRAPQCSSQHCLP